MITLGVCSVASLSLGKYSYTPVYSVNVLGISCPTCAHILHPYLPEDIHQEIGLLQDHVCKYSRKYYLPTALTLA